jgi:sec-independent protein translocase protein TatA
VGNLTGWHFLAVVLVILVLFAAPKLPGLARSLGQSMRIFRSEVRTMKNENADDAPVTTDDTARPDVPASGSSTEPKPKP